MKKVIALFLALAVSFSLLTACGGSGAGEAATTDGASAKETAAEVTESEGNGETAAVESDGEKYIIAGSNSDCVTFAPWGEMGGGRKAVRRALYETLTYLNTDGSVDCDLAKEIKEKGNGVYEVTIYDYIVDSAGNPMTASDVVFSFEKAQEVGTLATYFAGLESFKATGDYTVEFKFSNEQKGGLYILFDYVYIITEAAWEQSGDEMTLNPIGTAPYVLKDYVSGQKMEFVKADTYWQTDDLTIDALKANLDGFTWLVISEKSQHSIALESGTIDCTNAITSADEVNFIDADGNVKDGYGYVESFKTNLVVIDYNCSDTSKCSDENLRKAISYAIDSQALIQSAYGTAGVQARNYTIGAYRDSDEKFNLDEYFDYSVDKAKEYLAKSNYSGEPLVLLCNSDTENTTMATLVQAYCAAAGINVNVEYYDKNLTTAYLADMTYNFDMYLGMSNASYYAFEPPCYLTNHYYENGTGITRIADDKLTELYDIASAKDTSSTETLMDLFEYINDKCYSYGIGGYTQKVFFNSNKIETLGVTSDLFNPTPYTSVLK